MEEEYNSGCYEQTILIPISLLDKVIRYIEATEEELDGEWGSARNVDRLLELGFMPKIYTELLAVRNTKN